MTLKKISLLFLIALLLPTLGMAQEENSDNRSESEYTLTIQAEIVNDAGKNVKRMTINGSIPGPTLEFTEGEFAIIHVKNTMDVETSVHWHGILLPNFQDGVPYLTTPPIKPGATFTYTFPIDQAGTYWYHSHTMLQEQSGLYGSIVIHPKEKTLAYDTDLVLLLSDWTNEKPKDVLRTLKRGTEWYNIKKGTATPLNQVIGRGAFGAQLDFWRQRMEGADIADVYYPAFLVNGKSEIGYPELKPGERVRLRIINGAASTSFWMTFGGDLTTLVSADGLDVDPVRRNKTFIGVAETYDFLVTIPENGKIEFRAMAQDGSGTARAYLGNGPILKADEVARPDKIGMMQQMANMDMKMGAHALKFNPKKDERFEMKAEYGMKMDHGAMNHGEMHTLQMVQTKSNRPKDSMSHRMMDHSKMNHDKMKIKADTTSSKMVDHIKMDHTKGNHASMKFKTDTSSSKIVDHSNMDHSKMNHDKMKMKADTSSSKIVDHSKMDYSKMNHDAMNMSDMDMETNGMQMDGMSMYSEYNYEYLKSPQVTSYSEDVPVKDILLNLTGNMNRYIWSFNGVPLSETDNIPIKENEVTRITFNNLTMMHHPLHLHGHFFRVLNKNGDYSPLKHTVNIPPMQELTIEFYGDTYGDWLFHCHILYHMMSGMTRVFSYETPSDERMKDFPVKKLIDESNRFYSWGMLDLASHMTELNLTTSNLRNQFNISAEVGWNENMEAEFTYERYLHDYLRIFGGVNVENEMDKNLEVLNTSVIVGIRYLTPFLFNLDIRLDHHLRPEIRLNRELMLFPRTVVFGNFEYQADFGWVNDLPNNSNFEKEITWSAGIEYLLSKNISLMASYDNRFEAGGGLSIRF